MERHLRAIFAADMVGYSRLMEADEVGTIARQKIHRQELIDPTIEKYHGRIVKTTGDGMLVEFSSVVDAVQCGVTVQQAMVDREAEIPEDRRIHYRVGINLGDVIFEDDDIFGDGVNIAARLEQMAEPGGIYISGTTYDQLKANVDVGYESLGEIQVKNIEHPVRVYRILFNPDQAGTVIEKPRKSGGTQVGVAAAAGAALVALAGVLAWVWLGATPPEQMRTADGTGLDGQRPHQALVAGIPADRPSIAVLPFNNMSNDPEQDYFSDGMTEDLITDLSQVSGLFVIARNTVFTYKGRAINIRDVGAELGVRYVLEGSVRRAGDDLRINAQLIDAETGGHLWAQRYNRKLTDVFALQDEVVQKIVSALAITLNPVEEKRLSRTAQVNPEAYDILLRGLERLRRFSNETNVEAREYFQRAIALDPKFTRAYSALAFSHAVDIIMNWTDDLETSSAEALQLAKQALRLDPSVHQTYFALSATYRHTHRLDEAITAARQSIALDPNYADGYGELAANLNYAGKPDEALAAIGEATRLNPSRPFFYVWMEGFSHYLLGHLDKAAELFEQVKRSNPHFPLAHKMLAATYSEMGRIDDAEWAAEELMVLVPQFTLAQERERIPFKDDAVRERFLKALQKAGIS